MHDPITIEEFKQAAGEFGREAPTLSRRELEAGKNAVAKLYLGITPATELNLFTGKMYLEHAMKAYFSRDAVLIYGYDPMQRLKELVG